ncbi:MAG TPA: conjugation system SOS inhibitor PsiB family protein [Scandinavium sp.]|jgi:hypothetical protein
MQNIITAYDLSHFLPFDFEEYRNGGETLRRELTNAVIHELTVPADWNINGEARTELEACFPCSAACPHCMTSFTSHCTVPAT